MKRFGMALAITMLSISGAFATPSAATRPNVIVILTDDEDKKVHPHSEIRQLMGGLEFVNYCTEIAFCCPSRASMLTGLSARQHGITHNDPPLGGYAGFVASGLEAQNFATWLPEEYNAALIGKYFNKAEDGEAAAGFDHSLVLESVYFNPRALKNGESVQLVGYHTDIVAEEAVRYIRSQRNTNRPFLLQVGLYAPHAPADAPGRYADRFADERYPRTPAFGLVNETMPEYFRKQPALTDRMPHGLETWEKAIDRHWRERKRSMLPVVDLVRDLMQALRDTGQLENTYVVYTTDNGFHMGEYNEFFGKTQAHPTDTNVPFRIRGPGISEGVVSAPVLNYDLPATLAELTGATPPFPIDGRSFAPLLRNPNAEWTRTAFGVYRTQDEEKRNDPAAVYDGLYVIDPKRDVHLLFVRYHNGDEELYDIRRDPYLIANLVPTASKELLAALRERNHALASCKGAECRRLQDAPLVPAVASADADTTKGG